MHLSSKLHIVEWRLSFSLTSCIKAPVSVSLRTSLCLTFNWKI